MGNESIAPILIIILILSTVILLIASVAVFIIGFNRDTKYIVSQMQDSANYREYRYWRRELQCHYLCLIPFVTKHNVISLYRFFYERPKHEKKEKRSDGIFHIIAPSMVGVCICAVCLCSASWAWFTASSGTGLEKVQAANYTVSITSQIGENSPVSAESQSNGEYHISLESGNTYKISITAGGTATTGFCSVKIGGNTYHTPQIAKDSDFGFSVKANESVTLVIISQWGSCSDTVNIISSETPIVFGTAQSITPKNNVSPETTSSQSKETQSTAKSTTAQKDEVSQPSSKTQTPSEITTTVPPVSETKPTISKTESETVSTEQTESQTTP